MATKQFPEWATLLWRFVRTAIATAFAQAVAQPVSWSKPGEAVRVVAVAFIAAFLVTLSKLVRDKWGAPESNGFVDRLPV